MILETIIPIPMPIHHGGGSLSPTQGAALVIAVNLILLTITIIRLIVFFYKKNKFNFWHFITGESKTTYEMLPMGVMITFIMINGIAFLIWLATYIEKFL